MPSTSAQRRVGLLAVAATALLALTGCGASAPAGGSSTSGAPAAMQDVAVGGPATLLSSSIYYGAESGIFEKEGFNVKVINPTDVPETISRLIAGDYDYAFMDVSQLLQAASEGLNFHVVAPTMVGAEEVAGQTRGYSNMFVRADSNITSLKDLKGQTMAVATIGSLPYAEVKTTVTKAGGDFDSLKIVELPSSQQLSALLQGNVDIANVGEPYATIALNEGKVRSIGTADMAFPGITKFVIVTTSQFAAANAGQVEAFGKAVLAANTAYNGDHPGVAVIMSKVLKMDQAVLEKAFFPLFGEKPVTADDLRKVAQILQGMGTFKVDSVKDYGALINIPQ